MRCFHWIQISLMACLLLVLAGCDRTVDVVQAEQFKVMADRMSDELIARKILDSSRAYVAGVWGEGDRDYGAELFRRLPPDMLFDDTGGMLPGASFATAVRHSDKVEVGKNGFIIKGLRQTVKVNMIAVTDWDGDGNKDWLVSCFVDNLQGKKRDYYVVVSDPQPEGPLKATVVAVYEDYGLTGKLFMRESSVAKPAESSASTAVEESVPGLRTITTPPSTAPTTKGGVQERTLD